MNALEVSVDDATAIQAASPSPDRGRNGLEDVATLFPGMEVFHDLRIAGLGNTLLLSRLTELLESEGAETLSLSLRGCGEKESSIKCRLKGLTASRANDLVTRLAQQPNVTSARVEHVILRRT